MAKATKKNNTATKTEPTKRPEVLRADLVTHALEKHDLPTDGTVEDRAERLEAWFKSEYEKQTTSPDPSVRKAADILACEPPDATASIGCRYKSLPSWPFCPFCGQAETDEAREALEKLEKSLAPTPTEAVAAPKPGEIVAVTAAEIKAKRARRAKKSDPSTEPTVESAETSAETKNTEIETVEHTPETAIVPVAPTTEPAEETTAEADRGFTAAYLDVLEKRVLDAQRKRETTLVETFYAEGEALKEIRDHNLFALVLNADGKPVFPNFGSYAYAKFEYSHGHASKLVRIVELIPRELALKMGVAKASALAVESMPAEIREKLLPIAASLTVKELDAKIKLLLDPPEPPPAAATPVSSGDAPPYDEDGVYRDDEESDDSEDDGDAKGPSSVRGEHEETDEELLRPKTVAVTLADEEHVIALHVAGSTVKPAKKISDGGHAEISTISGHKLRFDLRIGEDGGMEIVFKIRRPG